MVSAMLRATVYEEIGATTGREVSVPAVYVTLTRLERKGYVSSRKGDPNVERGARPKKFYQLEPAGVHALKRSRSMLDRLWDGVDLEPHPTAWPRESLLAAGIVRRRWQRCWLGRCCRLRYGMSSLGISMRATCGWCAVRAVGLARDAGIGDRYWRR